MAAARINLKKERLNRGLSIRGMAEAAGVAAGTLNRAESGGSVHPESALAIARFLGYQVTDIWPVESTEAAA